MNQPGRAPLFDRWAGAYDDSVRSAGSSFPFDGYEQILETVVTLASVERGMRVLDLGIGTGNLAARFVDRECLVCGIDFSAEMLALVCARLPGVEIVCADLLGAWPPELDRQFDRIVSAYVLHEFDMAHKVDLLQRLLQCHLTRDGFIVIGDVALPTAEAREQAHREWANQWDESEHYWAADEAIDACAHAGLDATYTQVSSCGGVFVVRGGTQ